MDLACYVQIFLAIGKCFTVQNIFGNIRLCSAPIQLQIWIQSGKFSVVSLFVWYVPGRFIASRLLNLDITWPHFFMFSSGWLTVWLGCSSYVLCLCSVLNFMLHQSFNSTAAKEMPTMYHHMILSHSQIVFIWSERNPLYVF